MTREEAMSYIIPAIERTWNDKICKQIKDVLSKQPSEWERDHEILKAYADGQESMKPCKDAISRQAAIDALNKLCDRCEHSKKQRFVMCGACHLGSAFDVIEELPPVSVAENVGKWIEKEVRGDLALYCSECGNGLDVIYHYSYCPNCGAKMVEPQESEGKG